MLDFIKKYDIYGKPVTFYYNTSTVHKTYFGAFLSLFSFSLMMSITISSLYNFLYQKPAISSNIVYFINKKFAQLEAMAIKGKLSSSQEEDKDQINDFVKYFRIVLHEKYFDEVETFRVAKLIKEESNNNFEFNVTMSISDVFKEKEYSTLQIMSCSEIKKKSYVDWADSFNETTCDENYENYFLKNFKSNKFLLSFDAPNYTIDRKGRLRKVPHQNELNFEVVKNKKVSYLMETKYVVIEDDTNIYYTNKKYDAYFTIKRPVEINQENYENNYYRLEILMQNNDNDQIVLISLYKYKLLDFLAKLGGIMKIITFMKMTGKFWSSFFYETTLYNLIVNRDNIYLQQKRKLLKSLVYKNTENTDKLNSKNSNENLYIKDNLKIGMTAPGVKNKQEMPYTSYVSYCHWFLNRFCKSVYTDIEAKKKREMLVQTMGLNNYLTHLDYIDRQIIFEQYTGDINTKIDEIIKKNNEMENNKEQIFDNTSADLKKDIKEIEDAIEYHNGNNMEKPLALQG